MDLRRTQNVFLHESRHHHPISPMPNNSSTSILSSANHHLLPSNSSSSSTTTIPFPITAVAIIGILATAFLLLIYYVFVIKCCLNWHRIDLLPRFSFSARPRLNQNPITIHSPTPQYRGLDQAIIRSIPIFQYKKHGIRKKRIECECAVCLNEFQEEEKLRVIPNCGHIFHIDCIDIWLQNNANCPLCRTSISAAATAARFMLSPSFSTRDDDGTGHEDYVVIELGSHEENSVINHNQKSFLKIQEKVDFEESNRHKRKKKLFKYVTSMGDECIDIRGNYKDEQFGTIQPIRRSFSMDSASDPQLLLAIQLILPAEHQHQHHQQQSSTSSTSTSSRRAVRRSFFNFGHDRTTPISAVLPLHNLEP